MNVMICDDEEICRESITNMVQNWGNANHREASLTVFQYSSSEDLLEMWENGVQIDLLFLDIQIPNEMDGLKTAKAIFEKNEYIPIVFVTNFSEYACDGYSVNALRYLIKPVRQQAVDECMSLAWRRWELAQSESIRVESKKAVEWIPLNQIIRIEALGHRLTIVTTSGQRIDAQGSISQYAAALPNALFGQCHKSHLVNVMYVRKIQYSSLLLSGGETLPIGRKYVKPFRELFDQYFQGKGLL